MARLRFGENVFNVKQPDFFDLYKRQLLNPFCVFQLFTTILWCLDDYWQYSLFSLGMILMFEGTVVFQRIKSMAALKGMGNKVSERSERAFWMTSIRATNKLIIQLDSINFAPSSLGAGQGCSRLSTEQVDENYQ